jgi:DNA repair exonuclease SbcCD ATPase subunit
VDYQNSTVGETLKVFEALAFGLPLAMVRTLDAMAELTAIEMRMWWRALSLPGGLVAAMWPHAGAAEIDSLAMELEQIRAELRSDSARRGESQAAAAARFDHLQDQLTALRNEASALRAELQTALDARPENAEIDLLRTELQVLRQQVRDALNEREIGPAALADLQTELRALRDRMESQPRSKAEPEQEPKSARAGGEARKRPRR